MTKSKLAREMFNAYNEVGTPWKTFDGRDVPRWDQISEAVKAKWEGAAECAERIAGIPSPVPDDGVRLLTATGELVGVVKSIAPFVLGPEILGWGLRTFVRDAFDPSIYREAMLFVLPQDAVGLHGVQTPARGNT